MDSLQIFTPRGKPPMEPLPYTRESIARSKQHQQWERLQAAREMGIPSDLVEMYEVFGFDKMDTWCRMIAALKAE